MPRARRRSRGKEEVRAAYAGLSSGERNCKAAQNNRFDFPPSAVPRAFHAAGSCRLRTNATADSQGEFREEQASCPSRRNRIDHWTTFFSSPVASPPHLQGVCELTH